MRGLADVVVVLVELVDMMETGEAVVRWGLMMKKGGSRGVLCAGEMAVSQQ